MGWTTDLLTGVAQLIADASADAGFYPGVLSVPGVVTPGPGTADAPLLQASAAYAPGVVALVFNGVPQSPDRVIALAAYTVADDPALNDVLHGVQVRTRGTRDPRDVDGLDDAVFDVLHGASYLTLSTGVYVVQMYRQSGALLGADNNGRWQRSSNYYVQAVRPSPNRPD